MLLSDTAVARLIGDHFEPAWQSVRDVPRLTLDFGGDNVVRRTLHGNIATYVCAPDGAVIDVVPGLYDAETFTSRLNAALTLANEYAGWPLAERAVRLRQRHAAVPAAEITAEEATRLLSKGRIERPVERAVAAKSEPDIANVDSKSAVESPTEAVVATTRTAADGTQVDVELLERDTRHNEEVRRPKISAILAEEGNHTPESLTKRVYRDVLDADLDDPYLGLGDALFGTYPFAR